MLKYTSTPKPTPPDDEEENNPDGNKHRRGFTIMQPSAFFTLSQTSVLPSICKFCGASSCSVGDALLLQEQRAIQNINVNKMSKL